MRRSWFRKSIALGLAEVMAITSMLWAAPPQPRRPGPPPNLTPYTFEEPTIVKLARAYEKMLEAAAAIETAEPSPVAALEPPSPPPPPPSPLPSGPELVAAFAFGADAFTLPGYIKVVQDGANFLYTPAQGFGYSDISGLDTSPNNRGVLSGDAEIYDQFIGADQGGRIVFRVDVPNGHYRLVAAGGDVKLKNHATRIHVRDGSDGRVTVLVHTQRNRKNEFYQIGFDAKRPPSFPGVNFLPLSTSPVIPVTNGFLEIHQIAGDHAPAGGDLSILEIWQVEPVPLPGDFVAAFAFGADGFTRESPNAPVTYKKIVQGGLDFDYSAERGYGYSDLSGLDKSPNNPNVLDGEAELYDQFIGAKPGGKKIVFRVDVPNGEYRFVAAGGDIRNRNHRTSILVRDGSTGVFLPFVEALTNKDHEFYRVGFRDKHAPEATGVHFLPEVDSPKLEVTQGYLELHQLAVRPSAGGGDLSLFEIWQAVPPPTVSIELPADGTFLTSSAVPVRVSYTDAFDVRILVDAVDRSSELTIGSDVADGVLSVPDGRHELEAIVTNPAGSASATHTFTVDAEAPVLELDPVPEYTATTPLTVTGTLRDRDPATTVDCPSAALTLETTSPDGVRTWSFTCAFPLTEGANTLEVTASDTGGRQASASASTTLDTVPPELTIVSPTPDFYTNVDTISVSGGVFDDSPVTVVAGSAVADVTGTSFNASGVSIHDGSNLIVVVATDAAGNTGEASVTVFFDIDPPAVSLSVPINGAIVLSPITVSGTATDAAGVVLVNVNGQAVMTDAGGSFTTTLTAVDGPLEIVVKAQDTAGNEAEARANVTVDSTPPVIDITSPADGTITALSSITLEGSVNDATAVTLTLNGAPTGNAFPIEATLTEGANTLEVGASDAAGNHASASIDVVLDTIAPSLQVVGPPEGAVLDLPVILTGTVTDATAVVVSVNGETTTPTGSAWQLELDFLAERAHALEIVATDAAGNSASVTRHIFVDFTPPELAITSPATNILTNQATVDISGTVSDSTAVSVTVNGIPATVSAGSFLITVTLADGDNPIRVVATDEGGRSTEASVIVTQDAIPPVVELLTPDTISGITSAEVTANVTDNLALAEVVMSVNGVVAGTFAGPPFRLELSVPDGVLPGETVLVSLEATDTAGNTATTSRGVIVIEDGVIVGQVLSDTTSLPVEGATVTLDSRSVETGPDGDYSLPTGDAEVVLFVHKDGMTSAERRSSILADVGTVPVDVRLTPLGADVVTPLSAQGLPALLPLGWAPRAAFDVSGIPATLTASGVLDSEVHVAQYRFSLHEWVLVASNLVPVAGEVSFDPPEPGTFAFVVADEELTVPAVGEMLEGVGVAILPASVVAEGVVTPPILPPGGGIATGTLTLLSPISLPSGTVIQAEITETFSLASGETASEEIRYEDIVLFRNTDGVLEATFPIASSLTGELQDVVAGEVNLDILAGREAVRGVRAGSRAATIEEGDFRLAVPSGALPEDTAIDLQTFDAFSDFAPSEPGVEPLAELVVDLSGQSLALGAELSVGIGGLSPSDVYVLVRVAHIHGVPRLEFVTLTGLQADRLVAPGVRQEGRYLFYRLLSPVGFVSGTTSPPSAVVETAGLPFISQSDGTGQYTALALTGPVTVTASIPRTSLSGSGNVDVNDGETATLNITLQGQVTNATVTPVEGTLGVSVSTQITIASSASIDAASITAVRLLENGVTIATRLALSGSGKTLAVIPDENLKFETVYTIEAASLADIFGGAVSVPQTSFTTRAKEALAVTAEAISLSLPDDNGIVQVSAAGLPPGTTVLLVNAGNGVVLSLTVDNDGNLTGELPASISDRILITLTNPAGSSISFEKSKFTGPDGTTGIGPGGGTVEGPGGVELRIPEGALEQGATFRIEAFDESNLPAAERPDLPDANFGSGLRIEAPDMPTFAKPVDLAFPKPQDAPDDAFYYVYRRLEGPNGEVNWEVVDHAFPEGNKVVTASFPLPGYVTSTGAFLLTGATLALGVGLLVLVWTTKVRTGVVTGKVLRTVIEPGNPTPQSVGIEGVPVSGVDAVGNPLFGKDNAAVAISQTDGTYTLWDPTFTGGTVEVAATLNDEVRKATAFEVNVTSLGLTQLRFYDNVATANITYPPEAPVPPPPLIEILVTRSNPDQEREPTGGLVVVGEELTIGFRSDAPISSAVVDGQTMAVRVDTVGSRPNVDFILDQLFVPNRVGTFRVEATALPPFGLPVTESITVRVIAAGGSNNDVLNDTLPEVITLMTVPRNNSKDIPVTIFPQVSFTEPVTNLPGNVNLLDSAGVRVDVTLSGDGPDGPIAEITSAGAKVSALTIQPTSGLKFGETYFVSLSAGIQDLDVDTLGEPAPKSLVPFQSSFTTFAAKGIGRTDERFGASGIAVLDDRAFLVENFFSNGTLRVFDISDPVEIREIESAQNSVNGRPVDIAADRGLVAVATTVTNQSRPSNLWIFDVSDRNQSIWVGAASVANSAVDGAIQRVALKDGLAYALTLRKGLQVVDLEQAIANFDAQTGGELFSPGYFEMVRKLNTNGQGFGQDAVSQPIALERADGRSLFQEDLAVENLQGSITALTTGEAPLIVVDPVRRTASPSIPVETLDKTGSLSRGSAIAIALLESRDVALIGGWGCEDSSAPGPALATVGLSDLVAPVTLNVILLPLDTTPTDILLRGDLAIVSGETEAVLVSLADPLNPQIMGTLPMVGGVLALSEAGILLSTARSRFGGDNDQGGVNATALEPFVHVSRAVVAVNKDDEDDNQVADKFDPGPSAEERDLQPVTLTFDRSDSEAQVTLSVTSGGLRVAFWDDAIKSNPVELPLTANAPEMPERIFAEGLEVGAVELELRVTRADGTPLRDDGTLQIVDIEFVETREQTVAGLEADLIPLFNPNPVVVMDEVNISGSGDGTTARVTGTVKDYIAPIDVVQVNGVNITVTQTSAGIDDQGPFEGSFIAQTLIGTGEALIVATAVNALNNAGADTIAVEATRMPDRSIVQNPRLGQSVPDTQNVDVNDFRFRIELDDGSVTSNSVMVTLNGLESPIELTRSGPSTFRSKHLYLVPTSLQTEALPNQLLETRIAAGLGRAELRYGGILDDGIVTGVLVMGPSGDTPPFVESEKVPFALPYDIEGGVGKPVGVVALVGAPGRDAAGAELPTQPATVRGLSPTGAPITGPLFDVPPLGTVPQLTLELELERVDDHLYRLRSEDTILPVMGLLPVGGVSNFRTVLVDPSGYLEIGGSSGHRVPLAGVAFRAADDLRQDKRLIPQYTPSPIVVLRKIDSGDKDLTVPGINKIDGFVVTFQGVGATPSPVTLQDSLSRNITPMRNFAHDLDSPDDGIFVFSFTTGAIDLSARDEERFTVRATVGAPSSRQFAGSTEIQLEVLRNATEQVTDITATPQAVHPVIYTPIATGGQADEGRIDREALDNVLRRFQFVIVQNALLADSRLTEGLPNPRQMSLVKTGGALAEQKRFPVAVTFAAPGELRGLPDGIVRTQRLTAVPNNLGNATAIQLSSLPGHVRAAPSPLASVSLTGPPPTSQSLLFAVNLATDANHDGSIDAKDEIFEEGKEIREGIVSRTVVVNDDDDNNDTVEDGSNATIDGQADEGDMATLVLSMISMDIRGGSFVLEVSDKSILRVFDDNQQAILGPAPGPDRDRTEAQDMLLERLQAGKDLEFRVEGLKLGSAVLRLIYRDTSGVEVSRDEVLLTVAPHITENLTGAKLPHYPYIDFGNTFIEGTPVTAGVDGFLRPDKIGKTADVYIVEHKTADEWRTKPRLTDVRGGPVRVTIEAMESTDESSMQKNIKTIWSGTTQPGRYDVVYDFGTNTDEPDKPDEMYDASVDFIDGLFTNPQHAGLYVVEDPTAEGPHGLNVINDIDEDNTIRFNPDRLLPGFDGRPWNSSEYTGFFDDTPGVRRRAQIRAPASGDGPFPLVIIAHGNHIQLFRALEVGEDRAITTDENYRGHTYLQEHLARHGYVSSSIDLDPAREWGLTDGIGARAWMILEHIERMEAMNGSGPLAGKIDMNNIILIGHSRGGEAVVNAFRLNAETTGTLDEKGPPVGPGDGEGVFPIRAVVSIAPTTSRQFFRSAHPLPPPLITAPLIEETPYLLVYGSADGDVDGENITAEPLRLYDLALGPKQTLWIYGANHNFFNQSWGLDDATQIQENNMISALATPVVPPPRLSRDEQQRLASGYVLAFLKAYFRENAEDTNSEPSRGHREFFSRPANLLKPPALSGIQIHSMYGESEVARVEVDNFEQNNQVGVTSTGESGVEAVGSSEAKELALDGGADESDPAHTFFGASNGVLFRWDDPDAQYVTVTKEKDISELETLSFRVTLKAFDSQPGDLEMAVALRDADGNESAIRLSAFTNIPEPHKRTDIDSEDVTHNRLTKSVFKTIRLPIASFLVDGRELDLTQIQKIVFQFRIGDETLTSQGRLALDDIEFTTREP